MVISVPFFAGPREAAFESGDAIVGLNMEDLEGVRFLRYSGFAWNPGDVEVTLRCCSVGDMLILAVTVLAAAWICLRMRSGMETRVPMAVRMPVRTATRGAGSVSAEERGEEEKEEGEEDFEPAGERMGCGDEMSALCAEGENAKYGF
jgi:hypothetical protein